MLVLHEFEEMAYKEIARTLGCSIGTVMSRLFYARRNMAALLSQQGADVTGSRNRILRRKTQTPRGVAELQVTG